MAKIRNLLNRYQLLLWLVMLFSFIGDAPYCAWLLVASAVLLLFANITKIPELWRQAKGRKNGAIIMIACFILAIAVIASAASQKAAAPKAAASSRGNATVAVQKQASKPVIFNYQPNKYDSGTYVPKTTICVSCNGSTRCNVCRGTGRYSNYGISNTCSACNGTGVCSICNGKGMY